MNSSTKDKVEGALHQVKGKAKEIVGVVTSDVGLEAEGKAEALGGKVQSKVGEIKQVLEKYARDGADMRLFESLVDLFKKYGSQYGFDSLLLMA